MQVASRPIETPVALIEKLVPGGKGCVRILVFKEGLLPTSVVCLLGRLLGHI